MEQIISSLVNPAPLTITGTVTVDPRAGKTEKFAKVDTAVGGNTTIVAAVGGKKIKVVSYALVANGAVSVTWKDGAGTALSGPFPIAQNGGVAMVTPAPTHLFETAAGQALVLTLGSPIQVSGHVSYYDDDVS